MIKLKKNNIATISEVEKILKDNLHKDTTELLNVLFSCALSLEASDVHLEPEKEQTKLRMRIDGILHDAFVFEKIVYEKIKQRIKLISGLKLNISNKSQDGRFTITTEDDEIEMRSSSLPSEYGESIVIRILDPKNFVTLDNLGLRKDTLTMFKKEIKRPNGMIIITGPTGSGKTTTLYSALQAIQKPEIKIITIEDPIEYHLKGVSQSQVNSEKGYDFATGLQTIVRQDPDVILVGEIRDKETASLALQASLTGHLVFTTLHTNDAAGTVVRLQALGEKPENIAPAINLAIAQRLVRKLCSKCKEERSLTKEEQEFFQKELDQKPTKVAVAKGCQECNNTGYKGRIGVYEFFLVDDEMEIFISKSPSIAELRKKAKEKGMLTIKQDGLLKVIDKITTLEEIKRITG